MTSKQQQQTLARQPQNPTSASSQATITSLVFSDIKFDGDVKQFLEGLRKNYKGIEKVIPLYFQKNDGQVTRAVRIDIKSDSVAKQLTDEKKIQIGNLEYSIQSSGQSLVISKVAPGTSVANLTQDLGHNYLGVEKISRFYDLDKKPVDHIRIDFQSDSFATKILKDNYIILDGKRHSVQPYWTLTFVRENHNEKDHVSEKSQKPVTGQSQRSTTSKTHNHLTEQRVKELFREQQMQLTAMINEFENKWNARLSSLTTASADANAAQLLPIIKDLTTVCQQFNQQNTQMQRQLGSVIHRVQDVQSKLNNEQAQ